MTSSKQGSQLSDLPNSYAEYLEQWAQEAKEAAEFHDRYSPKGWRKAQKIAEAHECCIERKKGLGSLIRKVSTLEIVAGEKYDMFPPDIAAFFGVPL